jgi:hypothetical protein
MLFVQVDATFDGVPLPVDGWFELRGTASCGSLLPAVLLQVALDRDGGHDAAPA